MFSTGGSFGRLRKARENKKARENNPDPPTLAFLEKSKGNPEKKQRFFSSRNPSNPWKGRNNSAKKRKGNAENEKSKEKNKDWRVREGQEANNKLNFFVAENGPSGTPYLYPKTVILKSPRKSLCGSLFCVLSREMRHIILFLGTQIGCFGWGPKSLCWKSFCAFSVPSKSRKRVKGEQKT